MKAEFKDIVIKRLKLAQTKKIVMIAGKPSHGWGAHDFYAGTILLMNRLNKTTGVLAVSYYNGWPRDKTALDNADALVLYMDGGPGHPVIKHLDQVQQLARRGGGIVCMHYAVEVPAGVVGEHFKDWIVGYYESGYSINPHWNAEAVLDAKSPITRGVKPFMVKDEWYYNMRFRDDASGIQRVLQAKPDDEARSGSTASPRGPKKHIVDAKGRIETLMWAVERTDGGRGVGFTGGHFHANWANDDYRKLVLNAIVWTAGAEVPSDGVSSEPVSSAELDANADEPKPKK
ncbi:MAG: ThuA domain-containing protein [Planctomycetia bacterium]|nr:ThuA domain-containing protein [Planctomycetia bacterium]